MRNYLGHVYARRVSGETFALAPPSTQYRCLPKIKWLHRPDCAVLSGRCTCDSGEARP